MIWPLLPWSWPCIMASLDHIFKKFLLSIVAKTISVPQEPPKKVAKLKISHNHVKTD